MLQFLGSSPKGSFYSLWTFAGSEDPDEGPTEREPLISPSLSLSSTPRQGSPHPIRPNLSFSSSPVRGDPGYSILAGRTSSTFASSSRDAPVVVNRTPAVPRKMEKVESSKLNQLLERLEVESEPGLSHTQLMLTNHDLKPVELERRQWGAWNYVGFWIGKSVAFNANAPKLMCLADSFNINTWMISSSLITGFGLSWWQSWICVWLGYSIAACFVVLTGRIGSTYHIGFPVLARASFGIWGSLWPVFNRAAMACIWYGVQAWIGGQCVHIMIRSIWPLYVSSSTSVQWPGVDNCKG
jgi:hypothetical protein